MNIILGVTGSIAAYKAYDICRHWIKQGHTVRVILTKSATSFCHPSLFKYLGAEGVFEHHSDFTNKNETTEILHIELARWADKMVVAPATANFMAKISHGFADDLLSTVMLAAPDVPTTFFPAMNTQMLESQITQKNFATLATRRNTFIHPSAEGELACGEIGSGKLPSVETVATMGAAYQPLISNHREIVITTGSTHAPLDPVRYLTNPASGKTGKELAIAFLGHGHKVTIVLGEHNLSILDEIKSHPNLRVVTANTTQEVFDKIDSLMNCDIYISAAAFSDIEFKHLEHKLKKDEFPTHLEIKQAPDVLAEVLKNRTPSMKVVGFAAETIHDETQFTKKLSQKPVDLLIGNFVNNGTHSKVMQGFAQSHNDYYFVTKDNVVKHSELSKVSLAHMIYNEVLS